MKLNAFSTSDDALRAVSDQLIKTMEESGARPFHIALSGGETAQLLFRIWREEYSDKIDWNRLRFYWVDERCVDPDSAQSNYKYAAEQLFHPLNIPTEHVHRIFGEQEPELEAERYSDLVRWELPGYAAVPRFDCIILGIGSEGHTASIFPETPGLLTDKRCYAVSCHPATRQKRITMTGTIILKGKVILIPVVGFAKTDMLKAVLADHEGKSPAAYVLANAPEVILFTNVGLDK